ncbi:hypothetical protein KFZ76_20045 [Methylovulum psychrotolerans]|jgi:hypothetical protein|uniref:hypothetical protein n=1 Tax=Methylovulum psychrotolerans TaxID=1704499 RepID=UPI001BFF161A|nr:hypothetical protein [Methylovulum psychrotolerans]MBT9099996.1 hypothetical protein [Methylovulum psychrotolerans]
MQTIDEETIAALIRKISSPRSKEQRAALLREAQILDDNGDYVEGLFSKETIEKDKAHRLGK